MGTWRKSWFTFPWPVICNAPLESDVWLPAGDAIIAHWYLPSEGGEMVWYPIIKTAFCFIVLKNRKYDETGRACACVQGENYIGMFSFIYYTHILSF